MFGRYALGMEKNMVVEFKEYGKPQFGRITRVWPKASRPTVTIATLEVYPRVFVRWQTQVRVVEGCWWSQPPCKVCDVVDCGGH